MVCRRIGFVCLVALVACASITTRASRLIGAAAVDGTYCAGAQLACGSASTFTRWFTYNVPFWINEDSAADATGSPITQAEIIGAAQAAYQSWEDVPFSIIKFNYIGETANRVAADGVNTTLWYNAALDTSACVGSLGAASGTLAITILTEVAATGEITDADVVFDSADSWAWDTDCTNFEVESVLAHEYGHAIGIHHTELAAGSVATRSTMFANYFCDVGVASGRTLEPDDQAAAQCLYPEMPTVALIDETGSMSIGDRMADAQTAANAFVDDFADNVMAVASFAESAACPDGARDGYDLVQDFTDLVAPLQAAINSTSPCGATPMWESICCAAGKADEAAPSNLLVFTDTEENVSGGACSAECPAGFCGCEDLGDTVATLGGTGVSVYIIDITDYLGEGKAARLPEPVPPLDRGFVGTVIDFDNLDNGEVINNQYDALGVFFPQKPYARDAARDLGTSTHTPPNVLEKDRFGIEFDSAPLVILFENPQAMVRARVGNYEGQFQGFVVEMRAYNAVQGGALVDSARVVFNGLAPIATPLTVERAAQGDIQRVEIEYDNAYFEAIDTLEFRGPENVACNQQLPGADSGELLELAIATGGLYCSAFNEFELEQARLAIQRHMTAAAKEQQNPSDCEPGPFSVDDIQVYDGQGNPASPFLGQRVDIVGQVTVSPGTFDASTLYFENCSGGIQALVPGAPPMPPGTRIQILGEVSTTFGEIRISPVQGFEILGGGQPPMLPIVDPIDALDLEQVGKLLRVQGFAAGPLENFRFPLKYDLNETSPSLTVFVDPDVGLQEVKPGDRYNVIGVLTRRLGQTELKPRSASDVLNLTSGVGSPGEASRNHISAEQMRASYNPQTGEIDLSYTPACAARNHTIYSGDLADVSSYKYASAECFVGTSGRISFDPGRGDVFFLIVGENGVEEGSYGSSTLGERPEDTATAVCDRPQNLADLTCE